jgi:hypothetical protein
MRSLLTLGDSVSIPFLGEPAALPLCPCDEHPIAIKVVVIKGTGADWENTIPADQKHKAP